LETDYNHSLFRLLKDLRRWLFCQTGSAFHGSSSVGGSGQNGVSCRCDVGFVGRSRDRRWIQRSSADPEIVGGSRGRRRISKSENPESVGSPSPPRGLVVGSDQRFNSLKFSIGTRSSAAEHHYAKDVREPASCYYASEM